MVVSVELELLAFTSFWVFGPFFMSDLFCFSSTAGLSTSIKVSSLKLTWKKKKKKEKKKGEMVSLLFLGECSIKRYY